jgi:hypothetical protein
MRPDGKFLGTLCSVVFFLSTVTPAVTETVAQLQARFDAETDSVRKAKILEKLGDAQFEVVRRAGKEGDNNTAGFTMEKYRDNVRAALEALKKQHPDAEKQSNGYRQLEVHTRKGIHEVDEMLVVAPEAYKPPLEIVRTDLAAMEDEMIKMLFPRRPAEKPADKAPGEELVFSRQF